VGSGLGIGLNSLISSSDRISSAHGISKLLRLLVSERSGGGIGSWGGAIGGRLGPASCVWWWVGEGRMGVGSLGGFRLPFFLSVVGVPRERGFRVVERRTVGSGGVAQGRGFGAVERRTVGSGGVESLGGFMGALSLWVLCSGRAPGGGLLRGSVGGGPSTLSGRPLAVRVVALSWVGPLVALFCVGAGTTTLLTFGRLVRGVACRFVGSGTCSRSFTFLLVFSAAS